MFPVRTIALKGGAMWTVLLASVIGLSSSWCVEAVVVRGPPSPTTSCIVSPRGRARDRGRDLEVEVGEQPDLRRTESSYIFHESETGERFRKYQLVLYGREGHIRRLDNRRSALAKTGTFIFEAQLRAPHQNQRARYRSRHGVAPPSLGGMRFAAKIARGVFGRDEDTGHAARVLSEVAILRAVNHPNIARLVDVFPSEVRRPQQADKKIFETDDTNSVSLVMWKSDGTLRSMIEEIFRPRSDAGLRSFPETERLQAIFDAQKQQHKGGANLLDSCAGIDSSATQVAHKERPNQRQEQRTPSSLWNYLLPFSNACGGRCNEHGGVGEFAVEYCEEAPLSPRERSRNEENYSFAEGPVVKELSSDSATAATTNTPSSSSGISSGDEEEKSEESDESFLHVGGRRHGVVVSEFDAIFRFEDRRSVPTTRTCLAGPLAGNKNLLADKGTALPAKVSTHSYYSCNDEDTSKSTSSCSGVGEDDASSLAESRNESSPDIEVLIMRDILAGLKYLHSSGIRHQNLHPEHVLYELEHDKVSTGSLYEVEHDGLSTSRSCRISRRDRSRPSLTAPVEEIPESKFDEALECGIFTNGGPRLLLQKKLPGKLSRVKICDFQFAAVDLSSPTTTSQSDYEHGDLMLEDSESRSSSPPSTPSALRGGVFSPAGSSTTASTDYPLSPGGAVKNMIFTPPKSRSISSDRVSNSSAHDEKEDFISSAASPFLGTSSANRHRLSSAASTAASSVASSENHSRSPERHLPAAKDEIAGTSVSGGKSESLFRNAEAAALSYRRAKSRAKLHVASTAAGPRENVLENSTYHYGNPAWMAPEVVLLQPQDEKADIWSAGVMFAEILLGKVGMFAPDALFFPLHERSSPARSDKERAADTLGKVFTWIGFPSLEDLAATVVGDTQWNARAALVLADAVADEGYDKITLREFVKEYYEQFRTTGTSSGTRTAEQFRNTTRKTELRRALEEARVPDMLIDLVEKMLVFNPKKRWSASALLRHKVFRQLDLDNSSSSTSSDNEMGNRSNSGLDPLGVGELQQVIRRIHVIAGTSGTSSSASRQEQNPEEHKGDRVTKNARLRDLFMKELAFSPTADPDLRKQLE